jgi:glycogen debranching enzyme
MSIESWLAAQRTHCPEKYEALLRCAVETLQGNILDNCPPIEDLPMWIRETRPKVSEVEHAALPPWKPARGICPAHNRYFGVWNWDSAFHAMTVARWDPDLAREQIDIFLKYQQANGMLVDAIFVNGHVVDDFGKPPIMPWAAVIVGQESGQSDWLASVYPAFVRYWKDAVARYEEPTIDSSKIKELKDILVIAERNILNG